MKNILKSPAVLLLLAACVIAGLVCGGRFEPRAGAQSSTNPVLPAQVGTGPKLPAHGRFDGARYNLFHLSVVDTGRSPGVYRSTSAGWVPAQSAATSALATTTPIDISTRAASAIDAIVPYTPTQSSTINAASMTGTAGHFVTLVVTTSGTTSYTVTFGTNFKSTGTLATGTVSAKKFTVRFVSDGTNWLELSRTSAM
jgi:hypothetical protein